MDIEGPVPGHGKQPLRKMAINCGRLFPAQLQKRVLHNISCCFKISRNPLRVADQRTFKLMKCLADPFGLGDLSVGAHLNPGLL